MATLVAEPFEIQGKPVRIVSWNWRKEKEYSRAKEDGIVEVYQVTWADHADPMKGWQGDIQQRRNGTWTVGDENTVTYATRDHAALEVVLRGIAYENTLTAADRAKLAEVIWSVLALPGTKPAPRGNPKKKPAKKKATGARNLVSRALK